MKVGQAYHPLEVWPAEPVPAWVRQMPRLSPGPKLCFGYLAEFSGKIGPTAEMIAAELGVSERQAHGYIRDLRTAGLIETRQGGPGRGCSYVFTWHPEAEALQDTAPLQDTAKSHCVRLTSATSCKANAENGLGMQEVAGLMAPPGPLPPPSALPPVPPNPHEEYAEATPQPAPKNGAEPVRDPAKDYSTKQAFDIAVVRVRERYAEHWREVRPNARAPAVQTGDKQAVKDAIKAISEADGSDYFTAEVECVGYAERLAELGKPLQRLRWDLNDLRNGVTTHRQNGKRTETMEEAKARLMAESE